MDIKYCQKRPILSRKTDLICVKNLVSLKFHSVDDVDAVDQQFQGSHVQAGHILSVRPVQFSFKHLLRVKPSIGSMEFQYLHGCPVLSAEGVYATNLRLSDKPYQAKDAKSHICPSGIQIDLSAIFFQHSSLPPERHRVDSDLSRTQMSSSGM